MRKNASSGFTLFELMLTIAVASILAAIAVPNMRDFIRNNRLTAAANDLLRSMQLARSEAIKQRANVVVCASDDPESETPACSDSVFAGWIVFADTNNNWDFDATEQILERHPLLDPAISVANDEDGVVSYGPSGFANSAGAKTPTRNVVMCDARGNRNVADNSTARAIVIEPTGRSRATRSYTDVTKVVEEIGGGCAG